MTPMNSPDTRRLDFHYIALQSGFWAMFAAICGYQAALLQGRGFTNSQIGVLIAVRCLAGIVLQPLLGGWADRHPNVPLKAIVNLSLLLSLVVSLAFTLLPGMGFLPTAVVFVVLGGFEISSYPLMDAMAIQFIRAGIPIRYSLGRGIGSLAYAVTCIFLGMTVKRLGVESVLLIHAGLMVLEIALVQSFPVCALSPETAPAEGAAPHSILEILRSNPRFSFMLLAILFSITALLPLSNFLINILQAKGGGAEQLGLALFLMAASELPGSIIFARLQRRGAGSDRLLVLSLFFSAVKALALFLAPSVGFILLAQPLQMLGYGVFTPASVYFVSESVPPADEVRGQTLMMVASNGLGGVLGSLLAGSALDAGLSAGAGASWMLLLCLLSACTGVALAFAALRKR
ncbi:MFS transporter [Candidatus Pseudoscillospira sp. SGI.172]|uniref:MFS transporter n=1 Tax=Candidatus Pseudoscillospira sp. SGI.172 TaxID=3420582 RepID=UPI003D043878